MGRLGGFALGGLWYSPLMFLKVWNREAGVGDTPKPGGHPAKVFGVAFLFALISAAVFAWWLGPNPELEPSLGARIGRGPENRRREFRHQLSVREPQLPDVGDRRRISHVPVPAVRGDPVVLALEFRFRKA
jgi:hypothetical protein